MNVADALKASFDENREHFWIVIGSREKLCFQHSYGVILSFLYQFIDISSHFLYDGLNLGPLAFSIGALFEKTFILLTDLHDQFSNHVSKLFLRFIRSIVRHHIEGKANFVFGNLFFLTEYRVQDHLLAEGLEENRDIPFHHCYFRLTMHVVFFCPFELLVVSFVEAAREVEEVKVKGEEVAAGVGLQGVAEVFRRGLGVTAGHAFKGLVRRTSAHSQTAHYGPESIIDRTIRLSSIAF
jgi:hypothetical protein